MTRNSDTCTLCDLPLSTGAVENEAGEGFCCRGCREIHGTLEDRGDLSPDADPAEVRATLGGETAETPAGYETTFLTIDGMHCATCETFIESRAGGQADVGAVDASYITDTVRIDHDPDLSVERLRETLSGLGYRAFERDDTLGKRRAEENILTRLVVGVVFGMFLMMPYIVLVYPMYFGGLWYPESQAEFLADLLAAPSATPLYYMIGLFSGIVLFYTGAPILKGAYVSLQMRSPNMDLLVTTAAVSAWLYSTVAVFVQSGLPHLYYDVTVGIVLVVTAGNYYEHGIKQRATDRLADLTEAQVSEARRYAADGSTAAVAVSDLAGGDRILVREGERIPVDGTVREGEGTVDEAVVTGESLPVAKTAGEQVVGGSLLQDGSLVVEVGDGASSSIDRITDMVWDIQSANHGIQQLADRLATVFVPLVVVLAVVVGVVHFALGAGFTATLLVALTVLIVSCPCALGLATPLAIASSVREALERGIVVFDETIFERLQDVDVIVFDKTGTLTTGEMRVLDSTGPEALFERAALLETHSAHPIATAIATEFRSGETVGTDGGVTAVAGDSGSDPGAPESRVTDFESYATGVGGTVDGRELLVGNPELFEDRGWAVPDRFEATVAEAPASGAVPILVGEAGEATGVLVVGDDPRSGWRDVLASFDEYDAEVAVLTGDDRRAATDFEAHPEVDHVFAGVPPEAKAETVRGFGVGRTTVMVGDGTNDAPALASADLGIALGSGTALAADAADAAIVTDDLTSVETVFDLAEAANSRVKQNIGWAFVYNGVAIPLAVLGVLNPLFAAAAMAGSSLLVVTNSARSLLPD